MIDRSISGNDYNRLQNLDGIEDRLIYYLLSPKNKTELELEQVHNIWRILYYNDTDALKKPLPSYFQVVKLIYNDNGAQNGYRIFRSPRMEDGWTEECSMIKVYIDSIIPVNHLRAIVNVGVDVVVNTKIINLSVPQDSIDVYIDEIEGIPVSVKTKSRVTVLTQAVISLLNGAEVAGVGKMIFSREQSIFNQAQYGIWNNRNYEGIKIVMGVSMSGVS